MEQDDELKTQLVAIPQETALSVFSTDNGLDPYLAKIKQELDLFAGDVSTKKGRDAIASMAYKVSKSKTYLDNLGKDLVAEMKELPKKIDAERKRVRETLDQWRDDVRKPLTDWEEAEAARVDAIHARIDGMRNSVVNCNCDADGMRDIITQLRAIEVDDSFGEFKHLAATVKAEAVLAMDEKLGLRIQWEADQAELARMRAEKEERDRIDREARIAQEAAQAEIRKAEQAAAAERERVEREAKAVADAAARREAEIKAEADRKELELRQQIERQQREAMEAKLAQEAEEREQARRNRDRAHKAAVNNTAVNDLMVLGLTGDQAKAIVTAIAKGKVSNVTINY